MAVNYPNSPTNGQEFKIGNKTLIWNSSKNKWIPTGRNYFQYGTELTTTGSTLDIDLSKSNLFSIDLTQQSILSFINPPTTGSYAFTVKIKNNNTIINNGTTSSWDIRNIAQTTTQTLPTMDSAIMSFAVSPDGKKSLFLGNTSDRVYQLDMNALYPWDFSSTRSTYNNIFLSVGTSAPTGAGETSPLDLYVDPNGTNLFVSGSSTNGVYRYTLPNAWSLSGVSTTPTSSFILPYSPNSIFFKSDGTVLYILDTINKLLYQYPLTGAAFDITQRGTAITKPVTIETTVNYFRFKPDGTKLYIFGQTNEYIYQYNLSTPWDISTMSFDSIAGRAFSTSITSGGLVFKPEGDFVYIYDRSNNRIQVNSLTAFTYSNMLTWPTNIVWQNTITPELPKNQKTSIYEFTTVDGGATYHGKIIINNV